jgi:hypothetical protein
MAAVEMAVVPGVVMGHGAPRRSIALTRKRTTSWRCFAEQPETSASRMRAIDAGSAAVNIFRVGSVARGGGQETTNDDPAG